jgi:hypothetical protein
VWGGEYDSAGRRLDAVSTTLLVRLQLTNVMVEGLTLLLRILEVAE